MCYNYLTNLDAMHIQMSTKTAILFCLDTVTNVAHQECRVHCVQIKMHRRYTYELITDMFQEQAILR